MIVHGAASGREGHKKVDRSRQARCGLDLPKRRLAQLGDEGHHRFALGYKASVEYGKHVQPVANGAHIYAMWSRVSRYE
jgi:hypothetical protein